MAPVVDPAGRQATQETCGRGEVGLDRELTRRTVQIVPEENPLEGGMYTGKQRRGREQASGRFVVVALMSLVCLGLGQPGSADETTVPLAIVDTKPDQVAFQPTIPYQRVRLTVTGPDNFAVVRTFENGELLLVGLPGLDGLYKYELRFSPVLDAQAMAALEAARQRRNDQPHVELVPAEATVQSGAFTITNGSVVPSTAEPTQKVVLSNGDGVIRNSLCVGFDCPDAPLFDDSAILLMENNVRIKFGDTSNSPFPNNDWEIEANSNLSGGASYLGFNDCGTADNDGGCAADLVFAVESGARQNALYVESDGDIGIGTSSPVVDLHLVTGNTPSLRLDQDGSSGFAAQVWDIAGNEANFFIRDVTGGSLLPLRIRPGAPTSSIDIAANGDVGLGTSTPAARLHILTTGTEAAEILLDQNGTPGGEWALRAVDDGSFSIGLGDGSKNFITLKTSGALATSGAVNAMSDRASKTGFAAVDTAALLAALAALDITQWSFIAEGPDVLHIGPTAQDFRAAFGLGEDDRHITLTDLGGVALAAVQGLLEQIEVRDRRIEELEKRLEAIETRLPPVAEAP
jgi:hypothetical protein